MKKLFTLFITLFTATVYGQTDIAAYSATPLNYQVPGTRSFDLTIKKIGTTLGTFNVYWQVNNGTIQTASTSSSFVKWGGAVGLVENANFKVTLPTAGTYSFKLWVKCISPADVDPTNDTFTTTIHVFNTLPKKNVVLEVYKHQDCPPCYDAAMYTDTFVSKNGSYNIASIYTHTTDLLYCADGDPMQTYFNFAHPMPLFDRFQFPYQKEIGTMYLSGGGLVDYGKRELFYEPVQVTIKSATFNAATRELKLTVSATFFDNLSGDLRFNAWLTEDGLKGYQADAPDPNNFIHQHVLRTMIGGTWGQQGSLPTTVNTNDIKDYTFTYTIPTKCNIDNMHIIAMVQAYNSDYLQRRILNSTQMNFKQATAIHNTATTINKMELYPNPIKDVLTISFSNQKEYTLHIADMTGKILFTQICNGNTKINLNALASGSYLLYADDGQTVQTQTIVKE